MPNTWKILPGFRTGISGMELGEKCTSKRKTRIEYDIRRSHRVGNQGFQIKLSKTTEGDYAAKQ